MKPCTRKFLTWGLILAAALLLALALYFQLSAGQRSPPSVVISTPPPVTIGPTIEPVPIGTPPPAEETAPTEVDGLPVGKLVITPDRKGYDDGSLTIYIPAIDITRTIYNGTSVDTLAKGVGLYEYAQLPGEGNRNVSLAGHRNGLDKNGRVTDRAPFYYVDTLKDGDYLYLMDGARIYRYVYEDTTVVTPDDWGPIYTAGYSCLTITTCTPIGVSDHRMVVRGKLDQTFDFSKDFDYVASRPTEEDVP